MTDIVMVDVNEFIAGLEGLNERELLAKAYRNETAMFSNEVTP